MIDRVLIISILLLSMSTQAHSHEPPGLDKQTQNHEESIADHLADIEQTTALVAEAVEARQLDRLHDLTDRIAHEASHIAQKATIANQARLRGAATTVATLAETMHGHADNGAQASVELDLKRLQAMLGVLSGAVKEVS